VRGNEIQGVLKSAGGGETKVVGSRK
jgi:hypothetical protein